MKKPCKHQTWHGDGPYTCSRCGIKQLQHPYPEQEAQMQRARERMYDDIRAAINGPRDTPTSPGRVSWTIQGQA